MGSIAKDALESLGKCLVSNVAGVDESGPCRISADMSAASFTLTCDNWSIVHSDRRRRLGQQPYPVKHVGQNKMLYVTEHGSFHFDHISTSDTTIDNSEDHNARQLDAIMLFDQTKLLDKCATFTSGKDNKLVCEAGIAVQFRAALEVEPTVTLTFVAGTPKATIDFGFHADGKIGVGVLVSGQCNAEHEYIKPVAHIVACPLPGLCGTVIIMAKIQISVEGYLDAGANAVYNVQFDAGATGSINFHDAKPTATVEATTPTLNTYWAVDAYGKVAARISVKIGPDITVMITPGEWAPSV
jgi:hypothetical protein